MSFLCIKVLSIIALRNSQALTHNTEEMTQMARATEQSGREMKTMTRRMEDDGHLTKFLSEITAIFLPMTTMAVRILHDLKGYVSL